MKEDKVPFMGRTISVPDEAPTQSVTIMVPNEQVGRVIGKQGAIVKSIQVRVLYICLQWSVTINSIMLRLWQIGNGIGKQSASCPRGFKCTLLCTSL